MSADDIGVQRLRGSFRVWSKGSASRSVYTEYIKRQAGNWSRLCTTCPSCAWTSDATARLAEQAEADARDLVKSPRKNMRLT